MTRREKEEEEEHVDLADDPWRWIQEGGEGAKVGGESVFGRQAITRREQYKSTRATCTK